MASLYRTISGTPCRWRARAATLPPSRDHIGGAYFRHVLTRVYIIANEYEKALDKLEPPLKMPYDLSPGCLWIDPNFAPLKGNPRFEKLIAR